MAKVRDTVEFDITAKIAQFEATLQKLPGMTEEQAKQLVNRIDRQWARMNRLEAKRLKEQAAAAKTAADRAKELEERWEATTRIASAFGGTIGDVADVTEYLGKGFGGLIGAAGLVAAGIGAVGFAATKAAQFLWEFLDGTEQAVERLEQIEGVPPLPPHVQESMERWEQASLAAEVASLQLRTSVASALTPAMEDLAHTVAGSLEAVRDLTEHWMAARTASEAQAAAVREGIEEIREGAGPVGRLVGLLYDGARAAYDWSQSWGVVGIVLDRLRASGEDAAEGLRDVAAASSEAQEQLDEYVRSAEAYLALQEQVIDGLTGATDEQVRYAKEVERVNRVVNERLAALEAEGTLTAEARAELELLRALGVRYAGQVRDEATARREAAEAARRQAEARREAAEAARQEAEAAAWVNEGLRLERGLRQEATDANQSLRDIIHDIEMMNASAAERARQRHLERLEQIAVAGQAATDSWLIEEAREASRLQYQRELQELATRAHEEFMRQADERAAKELAAQRAITTSWAASANAMLGLVDQVATSYAQSRSDMTAADRQAALDAFRIAKAAALAQAAINAYLAVSEAIASAPPPANIPLAITAGIQAGAQIASIAAASPPEFPAGGVVHGGLFAGVVASRTPDHTRLVAMQDEEGVVTRSGMHAVGGEEGLAALNRGEPPAMRIEVPMVYRHRPFERFVVDVTRRDNALTAALDRDGRPGHTR